MTRQLRTRFFATTALAGLLGAGAAFTTAFLDAPGPSGSALLPAAQADEVDDAVKALLDTAKKKDGEPDAIKQLIALQDNMSEPVTAAIVKLTKSKHEKLAIAAIQEAARRKDKSFQKTVKSKVGDKKLPKDKPDLFKAYLEAAAKYRDPKMLDALEKAVKKYLPTEPAFSTRAIRAYGSVPDGEVVEELIKWLGQTESTGGGGGPTMSDQQREAYREAKEAIVETLTDLTGVDIGDAAKWKEFWDEKGKAFEFPDPDAPPTDWGTLREWSDIAYGYTLKLPESEFWKFVEPNHGDLRARITMDDGDGTNWGRLDAWQSNLTRGDYRTLEAMTGYYTKQFQEERFSTMKGDKPNVEKKKFAGRDWTIVSAIGENAGGWASWGSTETRVYMTQIDHILMRFEITVRLGAEPETKADFFGLVEKSIWQ